MLGFSALSETALSELPGGFVADGFTSTSFGTPALLPHAVGFVGTQFGTPYAVYDQFETASGFTSTVVPIPSTTLTVGGIAPTTAFGTPALKPHAVGFLSTQFGAPSLKPHAVGFTSTQFGAPYAVYDQFETASGFTSTVVPVPSIPLVASGIASTLNVGTPTTPTNRRLIASGERTTHVGTPVAIRRAPAVTLQTGLCQGFKSTRFGLPYAGAPTARTQVASGASSTTFGAPVARYHRSETASGFTITALGTPSIPLIAAGLAPGTAFGAPRVHTPAQATGARSTAFGTPSARRIQVATGLYRATRFGTPACSRSNTYIAYGIDASGRLGHPTAFSRFNYPATGFTATQFGTPACALRYRARMTAPGTRFGTPLLTRNSACNYRAVASALAPGLQFGLPQAT